ncbi:MAG: acyltransferase [Paludibacteraceae bacterium]
MNFFLKKILYFIDDRIFRVIVKGLYPQYKRPRKGYTPNYRVLLSYGIRQKIFRINGRVPWPVDFRSKVIGWQFIEKGICCDPGDNMGQYINAYGGLKMGNNIEMGPNTVITTTNHDKYDVRKIGYKKGVTIGNNVWIGANCTITAGVVIGNNVTIGAGCVIRKDIPDNSVVFQTENSLQIVEKTKPYEWDCEQEILN